MGWNPQLEIHWEFPGCFWSFFFLPDGVPLFIQESVPKIRRKKTSPESWFVGWKLMFFPVKKTVPDIGGRMSIFAGGISLKYLFE